MPQRNEYEGKLNKIKKYMSLHRTIKLLHSVKLFDETVIFHRSSITYGNLEYIVHTSRIYIIRLSTAIQLTHYDNIFLRYLVIFICLTKNAHKIRP